MLGEVLGWGAQLLGFSPAAPHPRRPGRNWPAATLGGDPSRVSGKEVLQRGCVGQSFALVMWDRERKVSGQKFACLVDKPSADPTQSPSSAPRQPHPPARLTWGVLCRRVSLSGAPNEWHSESRPVHSTAQWGKVVHARKRPGARG